MKPHEETWTFEASSGRIVCEKPDDGGTVVQYRLVASDSDESAMLAAQAPAMARLLLDLEWSGKADLEPMGGECFWSCCPECGGARTPIDDFDAKRFLKYGGNTIGHASDCELANVLRAAGVLP